MKEDMVLVTGGSGFIAVHSIAKLLARGYRVRATLRTLSRQEEVRVMLAQAGITDTERLSFAHADLSNDAGEAMRGAAYCLHVASPTPATSNGGDKMVRMAVDGTLRVLSAAKAAGVRRVVMTSASGAVLAGHKKHAEPFTEDDWTNLNGKIDAYQRSKTMAEQAAWSFAKREGLELATILPVAVMGPVLGSDFSHSNQTIRAMLSGRCRCCSK